MRPNSSSASDSPRQPRLLVGLTLRTSRTVERRVCSEVSHDVQRRRTVKRTRVEQLAVRRKKSKVSGWKGSGDSLTHL